MRIGNQNNTNNEVHLYGAYYSMKEAPYTFKVHEIPITKMLDNTIVTETYCMIDKDFSTRYFGSLYGGGKLNTEYRLGDGEAVYYSTDKEGCMEWLIGIYNKKQSEIVAINAIMSANVEDLGLFELE